MKEKNAKKHTPTPNHDSIFWIFSKRCCKKILKYYICQISLQIMLLPIQIHSFHACDGPSIKFCVQSLNIIMSCSEIRQSWVLFMPSSCLISDLFRALTFCLLALVSISVATVQTEPMGAFYLLF